MCMFSRSREWHALTWCDLLARVWRIVLLEIRPEQWLASFRQHRWDLEEEAENLIQEQSEDDQGWVWLP
ncbi:hypothetical protein MS6204_00013 [Escherichia coli]|nr:hypothetical protein [Escherichia coli]